MTTKEILIAARAKIEAPERWTQGAFARDIDGDVVEFDDEAAVCWCSAAALVLASDAASPEWKAARTLLAESFPGSPNAVARGNDHATHAEVLAAFDRAIAAADSV